jgi:hypothetical protein
VSGRPSGGQPFFLKMTIGNLLLSEKRLAALSAGRLLSAAEESEFSTLQRRLEAVQSKWQVNWGEKASQEYHTRSNQWLRALEELKSDRYQNAPYYQNEVRTRVLLDLLAVFVPQADREALRTFDNVLQRFFKPGHFIWQAELAEGFPQEQYWYLYGSV